MHDKQVHLLRTFVTSLMISSMILFGLCMVREAKATEDIPINPNSGPNISDPFPRGCVDCHVVLPAEQRDVRLSTIMKNLTERVDPRLQTRLTKLVAGKTVLTGQHPNLLGATLDIPAVCLSCHRADSTEGPPFAEMMHLIHLAGGNDNHYISLFNGNCSFCHKFDQHIGTFMVPSHSE